jgi:hypothetical protein
MGVRGFEVTQLKVNMLYMAVLLSLFSKKKGLGGKRCKNGDIS